MENPFDWTAERTGVSTSAAYLHLNHASTSLPAASTYQAMHEYLQLEQRVGAHRANVERKDELEDAAAAVATLVGVKGHQVAFVESASRAWAQALSAVQWTAGIDVFVSAQEWASNIMNIKGTSHARLRTLASPKAGSWIDLLSEVRHSSQEKRVPVVSLPIINCLGDPLFEWQGVSCLVRDAGGWLFVDASQAVGQMPVNATDIGSDVLVFPARKWLRGPRGIAVMVLSERALANFGNPGMMDIHGTDLTDDRLELQHGPGASRFEPYGCAPVLKLGLRQAALDLLRLGPQRVRDRIESLAHELREALRKLADGIHVLPGSSGIVSFRVPGRDHAAIARSLWAGGVNVAVIGSRYAPLRLGPGDSVMRLSVHVFNTSADIEEAVEKIRSALQQNR